MNCAEFERYLPEATGSLYAAEAQQHMRSCAGCSQLAADLGAISQTAPQLREMDAPNPTVWEGIEAALRQEGLIQESSPRPFLIASRSRRWQPIWLLPLAAAFLMVFSVVIYQRGNERPVRMAATSGGGATLTATPDGDDQRLLDELQERSPALRSAYEADLNQANAYIQDAKLTVAEDPNDEQAQRALVSAYTQRSMIYQMALERTLP